MAFSYSKQMVVWLNDNFLYVPVLIFLLKNVVMVLSSFTIANKGIGNRLEFFQGKGFFYLSWRAISFRPKYAKSVVLDIL
jgi:hypothetical protein